MKSIKLFFIPILLFCFLQASANEGMWLPNLLKKLNEPEMKSLGMRISAEDIYSVNQGSLKDAVVHFGGFCTGEVISNQGLLLTNHHCGYGSIQRHSTTENNYLEDGFWAATHADEIPNQGLTATFMVRIEDVTNQVLAGVTTEMSPDERQSAIDLNINALKESLKLESYENMFVRPFYEGNEYYLFITKTYRDVRLVGTPPSFIGKYGADTDNWVWPRHTGDFALFRIYADENNLPADYAETNKPYEPKQSMKVSMKGVEQDDFVFAFGFPGRTNQYLHSAAIDQVENVLNPVRVAIRERALAIIDAAMRADAEVKIQYASKQSGISNYWKKWKGEAMGLEKSEAVKERKKLEAEFNRRVSNNPKWSEYSELTNTFQDLYTKQNPYARALEIYSEAFLRNPEITRRASNINSLMKVLEDNGEEVFAQRKERFAAAVPGMFKDYQIDIDRAVFAAMLDYYYHNQDSEFHSDIMKQMAKDMNGDWKKISDYLFEESFLSNEADFSAALAMETVEFQEAVAQDPLIQLVNSITDVAREKISPTYTELTTEINALKRKYMEAQRNVFSERTFYPDANSTLRVSYGKVSGYDSRDAVYYEPLTTIDGVMEKYVPGDYEFDLDEKFRSLYENRDFGKYEVNGTVPVNFIAAIHTTGGNSGSPVLNADGHLVGLLFDGSWEGVMSDIYYSEDLVRSIMVDIRYVLFIIDKYAGATHLIDEMNIIENSVAPKKGKKAVK